MIRLDLALAFINNGGQVQRWHTWPTIKEDTVAAHSFGVAWFCVLIYNFKPSAALLIAALQHDLAEFSVGDVPAQVKIDPEVARAMDILEDRAIELAGMPRLPLTEEERLVLTFADKLDGLWFMVRERRLGSRVTGMVVHRTHVYLGKLLNEFPAQSNDLKKNAVALMNELLNQHKVALGEFTLI